MAHPRKYDDSNPAIKRLREICLALPDTTEKEAWGECTFRVGGKMFAMTDNNHHNSGHIAVWIKAPAMVQEILVGSDPKRFFKPPYVGPKGWVGVRLDVKVRWDELAAILNDGYQMLAPKRLAAARLRIEAPRVKAKTARK
ncbi:MAG: MmcQ/YjbR family DNA-binding protein [Candidatus Binataceae bacterium]